ncbi:MAG: hypothetical protein LBF77_04640 [Spirochaetaceae bacterium]|jgi:hypothetical protein|nr:hypothetical protein [Spirochaetaceae bacterium]
MPTFMTWYYEKYFPRCERNNGESKVEKAGYISAEEQIRSLMRAGAVLRDFRRSAYEFPPGQEVPDDYFDPTREPNFDRVDADRLVDELDSKMRLTKAAKERKAKADKEAAEALKNQPDLSAPIVEKEA